MRLSYSLQKGIMESNVGSLVNKFKLGHKRRNTAFFEDLFAYYVRLAESSGYSSEMRDIAEKWMLVVNEKIWPSSLRVLPVSIVFGIFKMIWANLGLLDDLNFSVQDDVVKLGVKNGVVTRIIGKNEFSNGFFKATAEFVFKQKVECLRFFKEGDYFIYEYRLLRVPYESVPFRDKRDYDKLNYLEPVNGFTLKDALKSRIFVLKQNRIYFRERPLVPVENTLVHMLGEKAILFDKLPTLSYEYFRKIVDKKSSAESKLNLLKTLLQTMGWGRVSFTIKGGYISARIASPPHGFTMEDDYNFLIRVIQGYLFLIGKFSVKKISFANNCITCVFYRGHQ